MSSNSKLLMAASFFAATALVAMSGCHRQVDHPWKGEAYRPPSKYKPVPESTYAPVPEILPSVKGPDVVPVEQSEADELDKVLQELGIN